MLISFPDGRIALPESPAVLQKTVGRGHHFWNAHHKTFPARYNLARWFFRSLPPDSDAVRQHTQMDQPIVVWRDGQVVWVPPQEIFADDLQGGK
jgi:hypothetical protein